MSEVDREKDTIICDLDGTIALDHGRAAKYLHQEGCAGRTKERPNCTCRRDWDSYFFACGTDEPNWPVINMMRLLWEDGYNIRILSGRANRVREITEKWLAEHAVPHHTLILRPENNREDDHKMKPELAFRQGWTPDCVLFVFEDRQRVVDAWRQLGYTVFQVAPGNF
jgi:hypothetical protein